MREQVTATLQVGPSQWLSFQDPALVLQADTPDAVRRTLGEVEQLTRDRGLHAVGFVTYEAAAAFGLRVASHTDAWPLAWFAFFEPARVSRAERPVCGSTYSAGPLVPSISQAQFRRAFARIKEHLAAGDSYQANFTFRMAGPFEGDATSLFADLCAAQQPHYAAYIDTGDRVICSASPELFFEITGAELVTRPMKGTARRGRTTDEDRGISEGLVASAKERAENVMVVDMVRNDLGRIAEVGSVSVPELLCLERFPTVWQMTSVVKARSMAPLDEIFAALHPSASVTGAPKVRTMELLADLEGEPRGVYTGAIGHVPPDGLARFNVAIRTAVVDRRSARVSFGIGSGVVWDSDVTAEYEECLLKAAIIGRPPAPFELLETLRWTPEDGYYLLERHVARLADSAEYFAFPLSTPEVHLALDAAVAGAAQAMRVRLLVAADGSIRTESLPHVPRTGPLSLRLAPEPVDRTDPFLFHKTTNRRVYERAFAMAAGADDVLLWNTDGEVTEATTTNVIIELDGALLTPPVSCGLLPGTCRAEMIARGEVSEGIVRVADLSRVAGLWLINSVHGARAAELLQHP